MLSSALSIREHFGNISGTAREQLAAKNPGDDKRASLSSQGNFFPQFSFASRTTDKAKEGHLEV